MRIGFVGCGAAGRALAVAWHRAGHEIGSIVTRNSSNEVVASIGVGVADGPFDDADVVIFATPDDTLAGVAAHHRLTSSQVALHLSASHPSTILEPTGAKTAGLHPLRAFADLETAVASLPGTYFFVEGEAADTAEQLARDIGGIPSRIATEKKMLYHAGATLAANYTVALVARACRLFGEAGVEKATAQAALLRLARGALDNVEKSGLARGLTGPVTRGEARLVEQHLLAVDAETRALLARLIEATIPLAEEKGTLSPEAAAALRRIVQS